MLDLGPTLQYKVPMNSAPQSNAPGPDVGDIAAEVERLAAASRRRAVGAWFPLTLGSAATLASLAVESFGGYPAIRIYWAIAGPAVGALCAVYYALRRVQPPSTLR